jgi:glycosyltransferase involved in cell wall biosynthesis
MSAAGIVIAAAIALAAYTYVGYPLILLALARVRGSRGARTRPGSGPDLRRDAAPRAHAAARARATSDAHTPVADDPDAAWPRITITVPVYNEAAQIRDTLESLLAIDYPPDRRQILIVSDASTDDTDRIVMEFAGRGVELFRLPERRGKTAAENAAIPRLTGEIIVNTDASIRVRPDAVKRLVAAFADPTVGVASGRDISVGAGPDRHGNAGESRYVGYEMWVRGLETRVGGIVGASGCLYAAHRSVHAIAIPEGASRDFAAVLHARRKGFRAVSVDDAVCYVPRTSSHRREYRRKVRTMAQGLETLRLGRALLDPFRFGLFAWMLASHKLCRWLVPWAAVAALVALAAAASSSPTARILLFLAGIAAAAATVGWNWPETRPMPRILALPLFACLANVAALHAWFRVAAGRVEPAWEPTRRYQSAHGPG